MFFSPGHSDTRAAALRAAAPSAIFTYTIVEYQQSWKLTLTAYLGYTEGLAALKFIYPQGNNGQFGYVEGIYRF